MGNSYKGRGIEYMSVYNTYTWPSRALMAEKACHKMAVKKQLKHGKATTLGFKSEYFKVTSYTDPSVGFFWV